MQIAFHIEDKDSFRSLISSEIAKAAVEAIEAMELTDEAKRRLIREILQKSS
ncbi:MAG: hypothetical protein IJ129_04105 [Ruminococcus sp.]|nr:hypothetical protein [Ruminococcus sp.]